MKKLFILLVSIISLASFALTFDISPEDAKTKVTNGALLIDVRTPGEYSMGHIPKSLNIDYRSIIPGLTSMLKSKKIDKEKIIVLYCRSGRRASVAQQALKQMGFKKVYNLGSIDSWKK